MAPTQAILFDIDGTLVDSVYLHVDAWRRAFADHGLVAPAWEIHRRIGKDGSLLVEELMDVAGGDSGSSDLASELSSAHDEHYGSRSDELTVLPGARDLVRRCKDSDFVVVLATSAPEHELEILRSLLDVEDAVDAVTSGADVETAKPDSTVVALALERAGVTAENAVMIGDATWDFVAATDIGVHGLGVRSGGIAAQELRAAGASEVFADASELLARSDLFAH
ncbi:HAD family hydrolase [Williamsia maris]|uniref:Phosphoglycolate phosphatase, HAD superfamily n=1 Tax=Williamsia maris TaxID=72806 RepID=A0ABT1HEG9_9NOCA|nr:HAD family hydrolase [Williamsia maris]MCP2176088.1 Phosphoglycolate phosphatase, HAD superfamily [Williamsia maris]